MKLEILYGLLLLVPSIAAHAVIIEAWGDAGQNRGHAIGVIPGTTRESTLAPAQRDTAVFSKPTIPNKKCKKCPTEGFNKKCKKCLCKNICKKPGSFHLIRRTSGKDLFKRTKKQKAKKAQKKAAKKAKKAAKQASKQGGKKKASKAAFEECRKNLCTTKYLTGCKKCPKKKPGYNKNCLACRTPLPYGCGRTVKITKSDLYTIDGKNKWGQNTGSLNVEAWATSMAQKDSIPQVYTGGTLFMTLHQINPDGGGPYSCVIDFAGTAQKWESDPLKMLSNCPGTAGINPFKKRQHKLIAQLPSNLDCTGSYGSLKRVCMVRCQNAAPNGPFGGCVPIQQVDGSPPLPPPVIPTEPVINNVTNTLDEEIEEEYDDHDDEGDEEEDEVEEPDEDEDEPVEEPQDAEEELDDYSMELLEGARYES